MTPPKLLLPLHVMASKPEGLLIIFSEGWMNPSICWDTRPALTNDSEWHTDAPDNERFHAFDTYILYGGQGILRDDIFTIKVKFTLNTS